MLTHLYSEALLVDGDLADEIWELWDKREISDYWTMWMWLVMVERYSAEDCV